MSCENNAEMCPAFGTCGGCLYQNISYTEECALKEKNSLELFNGFEFPYSGFVPAPSEKEYRNKLELSFGDECIGGALTLGMKKKGSRYETVNADCCQIADADFRKVTSNVRRFFDESGERFYHRRLNSGVLRYLSVRKGIFTGDILVNLVTVPAYSLPDSFTEMLLSLNLKGKITGIIHTEAGNLSDAIKPDTVKLLYGNDYITEQLSVKTPFSEDKNVLKFVISAFSFFQTNPAGAELLYGTVKEFAGNLTGKTVFDLYCGTGTIAQIISEGAKEVIGVELSAEAVESAAKNAAINNITNCKFIAGDVLKTIDSISSKPDIIIVDPPREGVHKKAMRKIIDLRPSEIIYVSCNPASLASDLRDLAEEGYKINNLRLHDMFPRTKHVECVTALGL